MQTITRKIGDFDDLAFEIDLTDYDKVGTDIEDVFFSVKKGNHENDDTYFFKTHLTGGITFSGDNVVIVFVQWGYNEYADIPEGSDYQAGLFLKFTGDPAADEHVNQIFNLNIMQDFLRQ